MTTVEAIRVEAYTFPTPSPESDGTLTWDSTTAVTVTAEAGGMSGLGWSYTGPATADLITGTLADVVRGRDVHDVPGNWEAMVRVCRNLGRPGIVSQAVAAVDIALWDLKAKLLQVPLHGLFGRARDSVPVYGSGGFTSMSDGELREQVDGWLAAGCAAVKIKVGESWGTALARDVRRVTLLRDLVGPDVALMVDANGGYTPGQAIRMGSAYDDLGVIWFEEPLSSDDLTGLSRLRNSLRCDVAAGEYADSAIYVQRMITAGAVDCIQVDVTRCAGYTEWLRCAAIAAAHNLDISAHCAPSLHASVAAAVPNLRHVEWFADHARLEPLLVDGLPSVSGGALHLTDSPGHGMTLRADADRWQVT
jgi:L-alanine-DL-glutamate epimerase-like enolase superfamily enzyme